MRLKNKAFLLMTSAAFLISGAAEAKLKLHNPFHHKHKKGEVEMDAPATAEPVTAPVITPTASSDAMTLYDDVGYAVAGGGDGVSARHATLPVPSYVEITNLDTGKTILAVVNSSGAGGALISLSPQAMMLLGGAGGRMPVRVRRVNPPEQEKGALLAGNKAGDRLDTPPMLLTGLKRKLGELPTASVPQASVPPAKRAASAPAPAPKPAWKRAPVAPTPPRVAPEPSMETNTNDRFIVEDGSHPAYAAHTAAHKPVSKWSKPAPKIDDAAPVAPQPAPAAPSGGFYLQVVSLSNQVSAEAAAHKLGSRASVVQAGAYWRVRVGPYATEAAAQAALGGVSAKGYQGVRITH